VLFLLLQTTAIEKAVEACKKSIINQIDGEVTGYWLLTEYVCTGLSLKIVIIIIMNNIIYASVYISN